MAEPDLEPIETPHQHLATLEFFPLLLDVYASQGLLQESTEQALIARLLKELPEIWQAYWEIAQQEAIPQGLGLKLQEQEWEVDLVFLSNIEIQALNCRYRDKDQPTDVLSFTLLAGSPQRDQWVQLPTVQLGSIFISVEWALQAASETKETSNFQTAAGLDQYLLERVIHGWLHLMGVNHDSMEAYNKVVGIQKQVLEKGFHDAG